MDYFYIYHELLLWLEGVSHVTFITESGNLKFWQFFKKFRLWPWKKKSTVLNGFFPCLPQMITSMKGCVVYNDLWPWPTSSRSFDLDLENRVRSVASTVLDGFFLYLPQMITIIRGFVPCYVFFQNLEIWIFSKFFKFSDLTLKKNLQFSMDSFHI